MPTTPAAAAPEDLLELRGIVDAIHRTSAVIEFGLDGTVLTANQNALDTLGYSLDEVRGEHHRMFCDPGLADSVSVTRTNETIHSISESTQLQQAASREVDELISHLASAD